MKRGRGIPPIELDTVTNPGFLYDGPGYYRDRCGERWLVGEDPDFDLVGVNVNSIKHPEVQFWDPCGRVRCGKTKEHERDLMGPHIVRRRS